MPVACGRGTRRSEWTPAGKGTIGAGLRMGFPAGSGGVARLDVAWPVSGRGIGGKPMLQLAIGDPVGLAAGLTHRQLARSRRLPVGADIFTGRTW